MKPSRSVRALQAAGAVFLLAFCLAPFAFMAVVSLARRHDFLDARVGFAATWEHYRTVLTTGALHFPAYLRNSVLISLASAAGCVAVASLAAYAITRLRFPGKVRLLLFVVAISMFPQIGLVQYLFELMASLGWIDTYQALILPYVAWTLPLSLWILVSYFAQIPRELDEAALVDGCSRLRLLGEVLLPVALPGVFSTFLLAFILAFNEFLFALMLTNTFHARTVPVGIALFEGTQGQTPWGQIMAASVITVLPVVVLTLIFQRWIVGGLTRGAVKG